LTQEVCKFCKKINSECKCPDDFCDFCMINMKFRNEDKVIHEMWCVKQHQGLAINEYQRDRLLRALLNSPDKNDGDWYNEVLSKLCILKYGKPIYDFEKIKKELEVC